TNATLSQKDVAFANSDGTGITTLIQGVYRDACDYFTAFAGSNFLVQHCDIPLPDGGAIGSVPPTLTLFASPSAEAGVGLATMQPNPGGDSWSLDRAGDLAYAPEVGNPPIGVAFAIPDASATTIDPTGALTGELTTDGGAVVSGPSVRDLFQPDGDRLERGCPPRSQSCVGHDGRRHRAARVHTNRRVFR